MVAMKGKQKQPKLPSYPSYSYTLGNNKLTQLRSIEMIWAWAVRIYFPEGITKEEGEHKRRRSKMKYARTN